MIFADFTIVKPDLAELNQDIRLPTLVDLRNSSKNHLLEHLQPLGQLIQNPNVDQIWLPKANVGDFLEIKNRIRVFLKDYESSSNGEDKLLKFIRAESCHLPESLFKLGKQLKQLGQSLNNLEVLCECHPGMRLALRKSCKKAKRSRLKAVEELKIGYKRKLPENTYADTRRPKRKILKIWSNFYGDTESSADSATSSNRTRVKCYMCKKPKENETLHVCSQCHHLNTHMRNWTLDLSGRYAIVTGGRIKIGFEVCLRLLRNNCFVVATTRFPKDALDRFSKQPGFPDWKHRLKIFHLNLEDLRSIQEFLKQIPLTIPHLDILINNAAQTIQRPSEYYGSLEQKEKTSFPLNHHCSDILVKPCQENLRENVQNLTCSFQDEQFPFPIGKVNSHGEQLDLRPRNSWTYNLDEVPLQELLEVLTINAVGPFILTSKLKPLLKKSPQNRKFVVNVSAMEGQFHRITKGHRHPHTNMAKAALNMMTRTSGMEFQMDNIFMTAVDTGWVTDERPYIQAQYEAKECGFRTPLDCQDAAARIIHPIFHGLQKPQEQPYFAIFLKDFKVHPW